MSCLYVAFLLIFVGCSNEANAPRDVPVAPLDISGVVDSTADHGMMDHGTMGHGASAETSMSDAPTGATLTPVRTNAPMVQIDPGTIQQIGVRVSPVVVVPLMQTVRTTGRFEMDERGTYTVSLKVGGWVERLYADYEGAIIREGDRLLDLYSPELVATQEEYLLAWRNLQRASQSSMTTAQDDAQRLLDAARRRLAYWDISDAQIEQLQTTGEPQRTITFHAPASGEVMNKQVIEGQQIQSGQPLMQINDLSKIWLIVDVFEQDLAWVREGTAATIELPYTPEAMYTGRVDHLYRMIDRETRAAQARIVLPGRPQTLRPGMYATATLTGGATTPMPVVPEEAVLYSGEASFVLLDRGGGRFEPRRVQTGLRTDGRVQILTGLDEAATLDLRVVTRAQFLLDAEARLQGALAALSGEM